MSRCRPFALTLLIAGLGLMAWQPVLRAQTPVPPPEARALLDKAQAAYYNLSLRGFRQYRFQARPDWASLLGDLAKTNPSGFDAAMKIFAKVRFDVGVDAEGAAKITHNEVDTNEQAKAGMNQVYSGMDQMLTGFFQTWNPFMITTPFSKVGTDLKVEKRDAGYRFQWVEAGNTKVDILTDRTYAVTDMKVRSPDFDSVIRPGFDRQPGGLVLVSYEAEYHEKAPAPPIRVVVLIKNKPILGLLVPVDLDLTAWVGEAKTHILMAFTEGRLDQAEPRSR